MIGLLFDLQETQADESECRPASFICLLVTVIHLMQVTHSHTHTHRVIVTLGKEKETDEKAFHGEREREGEGRNVRKGDREREKGGKIVFVLIGKARRFKWQ